MKAMTCIPFLLALGGPALADGMERWTEERECYVYNGHDPKPARIRMGPGHASPNQWNSIDLTAAGVPRDAVSVTVAGVTVITHADQGHTMCHIFGVAKHPAAPRTRAWNDSNWSTMLQAVNVHESGTRSGASFTVGVENGAFDWFYYVEGNPQTCSTAITVMVTGWCR